MDTALERAQTLGLMQQMAACSYTLAREWPTPSEQMMAAAYAQLERLHRGVETFDEMHARIETSAKGW